MFMRAPAIYTGNNCNVATLNKRKMTPLRLKRWHFLYSKLIVCNLLLVEFAIINLVFTSLAKGDIGT